METEKNPPGPAAEKSLALESLDPETEFFASKRETGHEWELFKENVRPLKRGRNVSILNHALKSHNHSHLKKSLLENRRRLIEAIDQYEGDDPLKPWLQCIKWVQEAFPPGGDCSGLVVMYEQCVRTFWHEDRYKDDLRYLKVWLEYAENCIDAEVIYNFLEANKIGLRHASFYLSYALHLEFKNRIRTANDIFNRGISTNAQPIEKLKTAYQKFLNRSMRRPKVTEEDPFENQNPARSFGTILARGEPRYQPTESSFFTKKKSRTDRAHGNSLSIYKDTGKDMISVPQSEMSNLDIKSWHNLGARAERNKENNAVPSKWTSNKIPQRVGHRNGGTTATPCIEVFVEDECTDESLRGHEMDNDIGRSSNMQLRDRDGRDLKKETELLKENPLRNFPPSALPR